MEAGYRQVYGAGSAFVHASSTASRLYRVGSELRLIADSVHVSRFSLLAGRLALRAHRAFLEFHGVSYEESDLAAVLIALTQAMKTVGA
jgi:hypothetical protein